MFRRSRPAGRLRGVGVGGHRARRLRHYLPGAIRCPRDGRLSGPRPAAGLAMSAEPISLSTTDGVAQIVIDRTHKRNAMSTDMWRTLRNLVDQAAGDPAVLVIILRGADSSAFASGADIEEMLHI